MCRLLRGGCRNPGGLARARPGIPRRLARTVRSDVFEVRVDTDFEAVVRACAEPDSGRESTWINDEIVSIYSQVHEMGQAHSVECWSGPDLVGGLYGISIGGAFFGESMFSRRRDASKVALVHLVERLRAGGYVLLDTQFVTEHLRRFGAREVPRPKYLRQLAAALKVDADFHATGRQSRA